MAKYKIEIKYPEERMKKNKIRFENNSNFMPTDRTPVLFNCIERYYLKVRGVSYSEFLSDSKTMLHNMILNQAWAIENIPDDRCIDKVIPIAGPWFDNTLNCEAFGAEIAYYNDEPPRVKRLLFKPEEVESLKIPKPDDGLWGRKIKYFLEWQDMIKDYEVTFNDEPGKIEVITLDDSGSDGPLTTAMSLAKEDFLIWALDYPEICHMLLNKITQATLDRCIFLRKIDPRTPTDFKLVDDFAELISVEMYRKLIVPYINKTFNVVGAGLKDGRAIHNCGNCTHLLDAYVNDLKITGFWLFGHPVDPYIVAKKMGGKVKVWGNLNCMTLLLGTKEQAYNNSINCLKAFAPYCGYILGDGANIAPDTPLENLEQILKAAEDFGNVPKLNK